MPRLVPTRLLAALRADRTQPLELPSDLAPESRHRVRVGASLGAMGYGVFLLAALGRVAGATPLEHAINLTHDVIGLTLCAALGIVASARAIADRHVLAIALGVQVLLACAISITVPWAGFIRTGHVSSLTWVVPIIILFAVLVPARPGTALAISSLCALTMPAGLALLGARGLIEVRPTDLVQSLLTAAVAAGIATVAARTVYRARQEIAAARTIGSYELIERLGQGGMGEVWKARHLLLSRPAAIKLILPDALHGPSEARDDLLKRFTREAQLTASLRSPHTVELFDFGATAGDKLYYAMELLDGMNLEHFIYRFGPIEPRRAVHWLEQACHSLGEAHERGLVHRDIKPANLFICRYGRDLDFLKVLDFGLARPVAPSPDITASAPGLLIGTPSYMAPEQVFGLAADARTDLYALGCVAYWLLAGAKPFESGNAGELLRLHAQAMPPALALKAKQPVPARLEAVVMRCLAKAPEERPQSADELGAELAAAMDGQAWNQEEAEAWWADHRRGPEFG